MWSCTTSRKSRLRSAPLSGRDIAVCFRLRARKLNSPAECLNVGKTPAQCRREDQDYGDHTEISEPFSSRRTLPHFSDHLEFCLETAVGIVPDPLCSLDCSASEQK